MFAFLVWSVFHSGICRDRLRLPHPLLGPQHLAQCLAHFLGFRHLIFQIQSVPRREIHERSLAS